MDARMLQDTQRSLRNY